MWFTCFISASSPDVYHVKHSHCSSWTGNLDREEPNQYHRRCWRRAGQLRTVAGEVPYNATQTRQRAAGFVSGSKNRCERSDRKNDFRWFCCRGIIFSCHSFVFGSSLSLSHACLFPHLVTAYFTVTVVFCESIWKENSLIFAESSFTRSGSSLEIISVWVLIILTHAC